MAHDSSSSDSDYYVDWNSDDDMEIDNLIQTKKSLELVQRGFSDEMFATLVDMGFSIDMIARAIKETAGSSKSNTIDHFLGMGFDEEKVIKAIQEHGEENMVQIANALADAEKQPVVKEEDDIDWSSSDDEINYSNMLVSDDEDSNSFPGNNNKLRSLVKMGFSELEASLAVQRCGDNVSIAELTDFICAAQMARESSEFITDPEEQKPRHDVKKMRSESKRESMPYTDDVPVSLPNPMIGFGIPNCPGLITHRPLPYLARGPPYFYYENVALAPKGVWETMSRRLFDIAPEFMDSKYICAAARKRGYIHNLPISNRFQLQPPPKFTIHEAFPLTKKWWPSWDKRTKLNCIVTSKASAETTKKIRLALEAHNGEPPLSTQRHVISQCKKWNLVWVGRNRAAPLEPDEMENLLGFPRNHTRGGGVNRIERYKSLANAFQVDTVAYHLSVLKPMFPTGLNVLSLFSGIGGGEVALHRLQIPMKIVVSLEISEVSRNILKDFWKQTNQKGLLIEFEDVEHLSNQQIEELMEAFGGFDLVIGGSPCNNISGLNRVSRSGLVGEQSALFFEYCRILDVVREKTARMRR
ncbi:unnamed protein product [Microthlaspi erraticum]|uniref:DNA (cytosine-5-)-methyltransferase n=1 Tax=Microthlaspi erraticum TaxID=1685480 RepID=A0A6D2KK66_9BRAS|nr:unnamed protein product [Microthlaspi erraticum]